MTLVSFLVEKGGEDLAANRPNAAFRQWCLNAAHRADDVIASARSGDPLALRHLVFALEAKEDVEEVFQAAAGTGEERKAGILALSRMTLSEGDAARAMHSILSDASAPLAMDVRTGQIYAALDIAGKIPSLDRTSLAGALANISGSSHPLAVHLLATALLRHGHNMSDAEVASCLQGIQYVDPQNRGTVQQIDDALRSLWPSRPGEVGKAIAELIASTSGQVGDRALDGIVSAQDANQRKALAHLATEWLNNGNYHVCSALASHVSEINRTSPCFEIPPDTLPTEAADQIFICRKAVGHFFLSPMTAAAWIIAVLRKDGPAAHEAAHLLFDPLLLNYGGGLKH